MAIEYVFWATVVFAVVFGGIQFRRNRALRKREGEEQSVKREA
jgi:hypothetical protein